MTMTPRQRWLALLNRQTPDRIPTDYQATPEVTARLRRDLECADDEALFRKLHIDARRHVEPVWNRPEHRDPNADLWGIKYREISYGSGTYLEPNFLPLAHVDSAAQVHAYRWPACDEFDYSAVTRAVEQDDGYRPIHAGCYEPFLLYGYLRGLQTSMEDLALRPKLADAILGHIFDFYYEHHRRLFAAGHPEKGDSPRPTCAQNGTVPFFREGRGKIDLSYVAEDLGSQTGPLMSLAMYRRFLLPNQVKMAALARSFGVHVMYHTDGAARLFLPDLIDRVGIEILNPIQWRSVGMERERLVADFGRHVIFHGSIDNQQTLPFGTVDDVVREVRESRDIYRSARWICAPCHNLQPVSRTENIVGMYEAIRG
jgi:uroporphyrinogen decarboxylase